MSNAYEESTPRLSNLTVSLFGVRLARSLLAIQIQFRGGVDTVPILHPVGCNHGLVYYRLNKMAALPQ